mgnify:CR=1 FL=1
MEHRWWCTFPSSSTQACHRSLPENWYWRKTWWRIVEGTSSDELTLWMCSYRWISLSLLLKTWQGNAWNVVWATSFHMQLIEGNYNTQIIKTSSIIRKGCSKHDLFWQKCAFLAGEFSWHNNINNWSFFKDLGKYAPQLISVESVKSSSHWLPSPLTAYHLSWWFSAKAMNRNKSQASVLCNKKVKCQKVQRLLVI